MRYFLFVYSFTVPGEFGFGNLFFKANDFPSNELLKSKAVDFVKTITTKEPINIVIHGWSEFSNKKDFEAFKEEK